MHDEHDEFTPILERSKQGEPIAVRELADGYIKKNLLELDRTAGLILQAPAGTEISLPPLPPFIAFHTERDKEDYWDTIYAEVKRTGALSAKALYDAHVVRFIRWVKTQLEDRLTAMAQDGGEKFYHVPKTETAS